jgi:hypothetical protein
MKSYVSIIVKCYELNEQGAMGEKKARKENREIA